MMLITPTLSGLFAMIAAWFAAAVGVDVDQPTSVQRMVVRDEIIIHVPIGMRPPPMIEWIERKGPKCLPAAMIAGASIAGPSQVDFVLRDRSRFRAELGEDCRGLDFYGGFYVEPNDDAVCAGREEIRSRAGASCRIDKFRRLVPRLKR